jgi:hypothetical protein
VDFDVGGESLAHPCMNDNDCQEKWARGGRISLCLSSCASWRGDPVRVDDVKGVRRALRAKDLGDVLPGELERYAGGTLRKNVACEGAIS